MLSAEQARELWANSEEIVSEAASVPVNVYVSESSCGSDADTVVTAVWCSATLIVLANPEIVGASATSVTVIVNDCAVVLVPSLTLTTTK